MTAPEVHTPTRAAVVPQQRTPHHRRPVALPPEGCGHDAYRVVRTNHHGAAVECRVCGAVGVIEA